MTSRQIEEFAALLVRSVRDTTIRAGDLQSKPGVSAPVAQRWREAGVVDTATTVIPDVVDEAVFQLLNAIDQGVLRLSFTSEEGSVIDLSEAGRGELAGWYMSSGGWRSRYSEERVHDDFGHLNEWTEPT